MAIEVLIRRRFIKEKEAVLAPLIVRLRSLALAQPGYISGETLKRKRALNGDSPVTMMFKDGRILFDPELAFFVLPFFI